MRFRAVLTSICVRAVNAARTCCCSSSGTFAFSMAFPTKHCGTRPASVSIHFIAYPAALLDDSFELDSLPPDRLEEETLAFFVSEIFEDILSMYSCVMLAIFDV